MKKISIIIYLTAIIAVGANAQVKTESDDFSFGVKLYEQGFYSQAVQVFRRFSQDYPQSSFAPNAKFYVGLAFYKEKDYHSARIAFQEMAVSYPESPKALEAWYYVGDCREKEKNYGEAAKAFLNVKLLSPKDPLASKSVYRAAVNYLKINELERAENAARTILDSYSESKEYLPAQLVLGRIYASRHRYEQAQSAFRLVIQASGVERPALRVEAYKNLAETELSRGRFSEALSVYKKIIDGASQDSLKIVGLIGSARISLLFGEYKSAGELINAGKKLKIPAESKRRLTLLELAYYLVTGENGQAFRIAENIRGSHDPQALAYYSQTLLELKKYKNIISLYENNRKLMDNGSPYSELFLLNVLRASLRMNSPQLPGIVSHARNQLGNSPVLANTFAEELKRAHKNFADMTIRDWGDFFVQTFPRHPDADIIAWWTALNTEGEKERKEKLDKVVSKYPAGDFISEPSYRKYRTNTKVPDSKELFRKLLDLQVSQLTGTPPAALIPDVAEIYHSIGETEKALRLLSGLDRSKLPRDKRARAGYLLGKILLEKSNGDTSKKDLLKESQNYFKDVVAIDSNNIYLEEASEKLVETTLIMLPDSARLDKQFQYYQALTEKYPDAGRLPLWLVKMGQSRIPFIKEKGDDAYRVAVESFNKALRILPPGSDERYRIFLDLAAVYEKSGEVISAVKNYSTVIDRVPPSEIQLKALLKVYPLLSRNSPEIAGARLYQIVDHYGYSDSVWAHLLALSVDRWPKNTEELLSGKFYRVPVVDPVFRDTDKLNLNIALLLGKYMLYRGEYNNAVSYLNYLFVQSERSRGDVAILKLMAAASEKTGQSSTAIWYWKKIAELTENEEKNEAEAIITEILFNEARYGEAVKQIDNVDIKTLAPERRNKILLYGYESYLRSGKKSLADKFFAGYKKFFTSVPDLNASALIALGDYYLRQNKYDKAMKAFKGAAKKGEDTEYYDDAVFKMAIVKVRLNRVEDAFDDLSEFLEDFPESNRKAEVYMTFGQLYLRAEKMDEAVEAYKKAVKFARDPAIWKMAAGNLIKLSYDMGLNNLALTTAKEYLDRFPEAADAVNKKIIIGKCYASLGQTELAVRYLKKLRQEVDAESEPEVQFAIGEIYFQQKDYETAIVEFLKIPVMSRRTKLQWEASALYYAGKAYEKMGKINDAVRMYEEIIKRPGILSDLKKAARDRINKIKS